MILKTKNILAAVVCFLCMACSDDMPAEDNVAPGSESKEGLIHMRTIDDYTPDNHSYILSESEPPEIYLNSHERSFDPRKPLQLSITENSELKLRSYSPRKIKGMKIWTTIDGYPERFLLAQFDVLPPFIEFKQKLPFIDSDKYYTTETGKTIMIMSNPHLSSADLMLEMDCDDPYYQMFSKIKTNWIVNFSKFEGVGYWAYPMKPGHCREAVVMTINSAYMFSSPEYEQLMKEHNGQFYGNGTGHGPGGACGPIIEDNQILIDKALGHSGGIAWGHVSGVGGLGGGKVLGLADDSYVGHYADDNGACMAWFHEFGHGMGYGDGNNTIISNETETGPTWRKVCQELYKQMCIDKKLPIYSRRFLHSRRNYEFYSSSNPNWRYSSSSVIIEDPELDEIDGGLSAGQQFLASDLGNENAPALTFKLDHETAGVAKKDYAPRDIYVYGDTLYVTNDIRAKDFSLDIYSLTSGTPELIKRITSWDNPATGESVALDVPRAVVRSNGKIYLASGGTILVYDALTFKGVTKLAYTQMALAAAGGALFALSDRVASFPEHMIPPTGMSATPCIATSQQLCPRNDYNAINIDNTGNVYVIAHGSSKMMRINSRYMMAGVLNAEGEVTLDAAPTGAAWNADGQLYMSFGGENPKFCEVNPNNGKIVKDLTESLGVTIDNPTRCIIRRNTLFIINRNPQWCVYAIPTNKLR